MESIIYTPKIQIEKVRRQLREYVAKIMHNAVHGMEHWLESTCTDVYENISALLEEEVEVTLLEFEKNLVQLQSDYKSRPGEPDAILKRMDELEQKLDKVQEQIQLAKEELYITRILDEEIKKDDPRLR